MNYQTIYLVFDRHDETNSLIVSILSWYSILHSLFELKFVRSPFTQKRAKQRVNVWSFHHLFSHGLSPPPPFGNRFWPSFTFSFFLCYVIAFVKNPGHHQWARISFFFSQKKNGKNQSINSPNFFQQKLGVKSHLLQLRNRKLNMFKD